MGSADALARRRTHHARRHALARSQGTKPALTDWLTAPAPTPLSPSATRVVIHPELLQLPRRRLHHPRLRRGGGAVAAVASA